MNKTQYTFVFLMAFSLVFAGQAEAKHAAEKTRARVLKEISSRNMSYNAEYSTTKKN